MPNRAAKLKQADAKRYIAAAVQAGVTPGKITFSPDGTVTIYPAGAAGEDSPNPCDRLLD